MDKKYIMIGCAALAAAAAAGAYFFHASQMRLDEPVFLTHYIESTQCAAGRSIMLNYITDKNDNRSVFSVSFPECPELSFDVYESDRAYHRYHKTRQIYIQSRLDAATPLGPTAVTKVHIEFSDGTGGDFDIGYILAENIPASENRFVQTQSSGADNAGGSTETKLVFDDCTLTDINSVLDENCGAAVDIKINGGAAAIPLELHKDETVTFDAGISVSESYAYNVYSLDKTLVFEDANGNIHNEYLTNIRYAPEFTEKGILDFLRERGRIS